MRNATNNRIDWNATAARAAEMSTVQLLGALDDILLTLPNADAMDRENGSDLGGYYRDEASVYRTELHNRAATDEESPLEAEATL